MNDTIPMPSFRMRSGLYEVIGTSNAVECVRAGRDWFLRIDRDDDAKIGPFKTKREALQFAQSSPEL